MPRKTRAPGVLSVPKKEAELRALLAADADAASILAARMARLKAEADAAEARGALVEAAECHRSILVLAGWLDA